MPLLFSYGTLQEESVQLSTFGRRLNGKRDELLGYKLSLVKIDDHANVTFNGNNESRVPGMVFEVADAELQGVDQYKAKFFYKRVIATLASGSQVWVYLHMEE